MKVAQVVPLHWLLYMHLLLQYGTCMRYASRRPGRQWQGPVPQFTPPGAGGSGL